MYSILVCSEQVKELGTERVGEFPKDTKLVNLRGGPGTQGLLVFFLLRPIRHKTSTYG